MNINNKDMVIRKSRGCLIGGAAGDALGYAVEFLPEQAIVHKYGETGIIRYDRANNIARVSDDTQMSLFTADALLRSGSKKNGIDTENLIEFFRTSYLTGSRYLLHLVHTIPTGRYLLKKMGIKSCIS